jgi:hypothetical protein
MNWKTVLLRLLSLAPGIVQGVETLKGEADGASKKQLATDSLLLATGIADSTDPADQALIDPLAIVAGGVIDAIVTGNNKAGVFTHKTDPAKPAVKPVATMNPAAMHVQGK